MQCVCRPDLIGKIQKRIGEIVEERCGKDAQVDTDEALKIYNDYCSSNGFAVPGYTYISTQTVRRSTGLAAATGDAPTTTRVPTATDERSGPYVTGGATTVTATATVYRSASAEPPRAALPWPWIQLFSLLVATSVFLLNSFALAGNVVVTYTEPAPPPAVSKVITAVQTIQTEPIVSTFVVTDNEGLESTRMVSLLGSNRAIDVSSTDTTPTGSGGDISKERKLSQLEVAGIVIGIVVGIITTLATVWKCMCGRRQQAGQI